MTILRDPYPLAESMDTCARGESEMAASKHDFEAIQQGESVASSLLTFPAAVWSAEFAAREANITSAKRNPATGAGSVSASACQGSASASPLTPS